jgi:hypothetical protein
MQLIQREFYIESKATMQRMLSYGMSVVDLEKQFKEILTK